jgi:F-type H+-transporting ATPase subunit epsilon
VPGGGYTPRLVWNLAAPPGLRSGALARNSDFETATDGEEYVAVDEGVLVKTGLDVSISVRNAIRGTDLSQLHAAVKREFLVLNEQERNVRSVMAKMESGFIHGLVELHHE